VTTRQVHVPKRGDVVMLVGTLKGAGKAAVIDRG
jgi:hypothetical protein